MPLNMPIPPAGYITKDLDPTKFTKQVYEDYIKEGLKALNLEMLGSVPLSNTSGMSKHYDRDPVNTFIYCIANGLI
ncbi:hypothetical protein RXP87_29825, partial [Pseudomonas aeruginosa]|nr:hypothetical protein [Pseudomonas aeruginosa]